MTSLARYFAFISALVGLLLVFNACYIKLKAQLAQVLIASAYAKQLSTNQPQKPWPWADTKIIASININGQLDYILSGASLRNMAFGPAHLSHTALPGNHGNSVIMGHRDTHFKHLQYVQIGQVIVLNKMGTTIHYRVEETAVIEETQWQVTGDLPSSALTLITCYPFNDISPNTKQRFVVRAIKIS